jgi:hypothetical protein
MREIDGYGRRRAITDRGCSFVGTGLPVTAPHADSVSPDADSGCLDSRRLRARQW